MKIYLFDDVVTVISKDRLILPKIWDIPKTVFIRRVVTHMRVFLEISFEEKEESKAMSVDTGLKITIPAEYRKRLKIQEGDEFVVFIPEDEKSFLLIKKEEL